MSTYSEREAGCDLLTFTHLHTWPIAAEFMESYMNCNALKIAPPPDSDRKMWGGGSATV